MIEPLIVLASSFAQQVAGSMNSRARNRSHYGYHSLTSTFSHGCFIATMATMFAGGFTPSLIAIYIVGGVAGSVTGTWVSSRIERALGAVVN